MNPYSSTSPDKKEDIKTSNPKTKSAGIKGVIESLKHVFRYMSPIDGFRTLFKLNQKGGVDCPGCAWPDPDDDRSSLGEYCENGVKAIAEEAQNKTIGEEFFRNHSIEDLKEMSDFELGKLGRLAQPMVYRRGDSHYTPISWEEAIFTMADQLKAFEDPNKAIFYTSGRTSNEAAFLYQLFVRAYGTNNLPDCSNMCHESSGVALSETVGIGKGTVKLTDLYEADVIMVMGQNPGTNHPRMLKALEKCKENGGKIISVNPLPETGMMNFVDPQKPMKVFKGGTRLSDLFLQVRINGDIALLKAIMKHLLELEQSEGNIIDKEFIDEYTDKYDDLKEDLARYEMDELVYQSGVEKAAIIKAAEMLASTGKIIICWAMGITQHKNGVANIKEIVNLLLMKGAIGKDGAGTCPVRGHSNVQGDRTVGIWESPPESLLNSIEETFGFKPPHEHGYATVDALEAMHEGKAEFFLGLGGNFLSATPDTDYTAEALKNCKLTAHISTKLNRSHLTCGETALILPCLGRTNIDMQKSGEQFVSVENSMGIVHSSQGILPPPSDHLLSEVAIISLLAMATLENKYDIQWQEMMNNYDLIRDKIEEVIPGFDDYNRRVRQDTGFYLPNSAREREFNTDNGKAHFTVNALSEIDINSEQFTLMTIRSHDQFNTTIYGLDDRYRGVYNGRRVVFMHQEDMREMGFEKFDEVNITSHYEGVDRTIEEFKVIPFSIPRGCLAAYFPEANPLVPHNEYADGSKTPISKSIQVTVERSLALA